MFRFATQHKHFYNLDLTFFLMHKKHFN